MIQINELVVIEVPVGCKYHMRELEVAIYDGDFAVHQLPAPCDIIGLASEVDEQQANEILHMVECLAWEKKGVISFMQRWLDKLYKVGLPNDTSDYLFLKMKR